MDKEKQTSVYTLYWIKRTKYANCYVASTYGLPCGRSAETNSMIVGVYTDGVQALNRAKEAVTAWRENMKVKKHSEKKANRTEVDIYRTITKDDYKDLVLMDDGDDSKTLFHVEYWNNDLDAKCCLYISKTALN